MFRIYIFFQSSRREDFERIRGMFEELLNIFREIVEFNSPQILVQFIQFYVSALTMLYFTQSSIRLMSYFMAIVLIGRAMSTFFQVFKITSDCQKVIDQVLIINFICYFRKNCEIADRQNQWYHPGWKILWTGFANKRRGCIACIFDGFHFTIFLYFWQLQQLEMCSDKMKAALNVSGFFQINSSTFFGVSWKKSWKWKQPKAPLGLVCERLDDVLGDHGAVQLGDNGVREPEPEWDLWRIESTIRGFFPSPIRKTSAIFWICTCISIFSCYQNF